MHHSRSLLAKTSIALMSVFVAISVKAEPNDNSSETLTRSASSGLSLQAKLSKNAYRQEPYQANYTVQVPYEDEETYYVDVPYEEEESYTDYETTYTNEYICHDYTDYEQRCHTESECNHGSPGNVIAAKLGDVISRPRDPGGDPGPAPYPDNPRPDPYPGPTCHDHEVCENVPVTKQNCSYEQVAHNTPVTKTRTVTRYRQESRTRTVTKYRDEDRCCVTQYRDVFDHQWGLDVQIQFPQGTELLNSEQESFQLEISGTESAPDITVTPVTTVFGYKVLSKKIDHGSVTLVLQQIPRYKAADLKETTLQNFTAVPTANSLSYQFLDNALYPRVASSHQLILQDAVTHEIVAQSQVENTPQRQISGELPVNWDYSRNYEVILKIHREGSVIENSSVDFEIHQPLQMVLDMAALKDEGKISAGLSGNLSNARVLFKDATIPYSTVSSKYYISLLRKNLLGKDVVFGEKGFSRTSLKVNADGNYSVSVRDLGVSDSDIKSFLKVDSKVQIVIQVDRVTSTGDKVQFWKSAKVTVQ